MHKKLILGVAICLVAPFACSKSSGGGPRRGQPAPNGLTIDVSALSVPTNRDEIGVSGTSRNGEIIRIQGGAQDVEVTADAKGRFEIAVPLKQNSVNRLFAFSEQDGVAGSAVPFTIVQDETAPQLWVDLPAPGETLYERTTTIVGRVSDKLAGFMGLEVRVNDQPANVNIGIGTNGTFELSNVPLQEIGPTTLKVTATDIVGNEAEIAFDVQYEEPKFRVEKLGGDSQTAVVGERLPDPLQIRITSPDGTPIAGKVVDFEITKSDGLLSESPDMTSPTLSQQAVTDLDGRAMVYWQVGSDAGCGNNRVRLTSLDINGGSTFCASGVSRPIQQINVGSGANQVTEPGGPAHEPLRVWTNDGVNPVGGIRVVYRIVSGEGAVLRNENTGQNSRNELEVVSDASGHAELALYTGTQPDLYVVEASVKGLETLPARFVVRALPDSPTGQSTLEGLVLDNSECPVQGSTLELQVGEDLWQETSDESGRFRFDNISASGLAHLTVIGGTATHLGGLPIDPSRIRLPDLHFERFIVPGKANTMDGPIRLPRLLTSNDVLYTGEQDVVLSMEGVDGLEFRVRAGSMTLEDGSQPSASNPVQLSLNQVHHDDIPMPMPDGVAPPFAWTFQPAGATFDPPVEVRYPNMSGLSPGAAAYFLSYDHASEAFEIVSSATVSSDGLCIVSDPNSGITLSGWGCNCPPYAITADCESWNEDQADDNVVYLVGLCSRNVGDWSAPEQITVGDITVDVPQWIQDRVNTYLIPDHHDVIVQTRDCRTDEVLSEKRRGFFADSFGDAIFEAVKSLIPIFGGTGFVSGNVADSPATVCMPSSVEKAKYERVAGSICARANPEYHLWKFNCQSWAAQQLAK